MNARIKVGDFFEHTEQRGGGATSTHYRIEAIKGVEITATPFKWGERRGEIVTTGPARVFLVAPDGELPANSHKVKAR